MAKTVTVPALDIDRTIAGIRGETVVRLSARQALERRLVVALCEHLERAGWSVDSVYDGEETTTAADTKAAMELIFNLDEAWLYFTRGSAKHGVFLVLGNGEDIVADWRYARDDVDGFDAVMDAFLDDLPEYF